VTNNVAGVTGSHGWYAYQHRQQKSTALFVSQGAPAFFKKIAKRHYCRVALSSPLLLAYLGAPLLANPRHYLFSVSLKLSIYDQGHCCVRLGFGLI
jgi:hypothetical protein